MIRVSIIEDERVLKSILKDVKETTLVAWAQHHEKALGYCVFDISGEIISISQKEDVFELLIRCALNCLDLRGVGTGFSHNKELFDELLMLGFKKTDDVCSVDIKEFFKPCCHCKEQNGK